jgi:hypothetical protein
MNNILLDWTLTVNLLWIIGLLVLLFNPKLIAYLVFYYLLWLVYKHFAINLIDGMGLIWLIILNVFVIFLYIYNIPTFRKVSRWEYRWEKVTVYGKPNDGKYGWHGLWYLGKFYKFYQTWCYDYVKHDKICSNDDHYFQMISYLYGYSHHDNNYIYYRVDSHWAPYTQLIDSIITIILVSLFVVLPLVIVGFNLYFFCLCLLINIISYLFACLSSLSVNIWDILTLSDVYAVVIASSITPVKLPKVKPSSVETPTITVTNKY